MFIKIEKKNENIDNCFIFLVFTHTAKMLKMLSRVSVELVVFVAIITSIVSAASASSEESWFGPEFSVLQKVYDDCLDKDDFTGCLKGRALVALNKAVSQVRVCVCCV